MCSGEGAWEQAAHEWPSDDGQLLDLPALQAQDEWLICDLEAGQLAEERERVREKADRKEREQRCQREKA